MRAQIFTLANQFTILRLALVPFFVLAVLDGRYGWALALLVIAGLSDFLDGLLARWLKQRTPLGSYLDPIADKLLLSTSFVVLAVAHNVPWTLTILVLSRDVLMIAVALVIIIGAGFRPFPPSFLGKACTTAQIVAVFVVVLEEVAPRDWLALLKEVMLWTTAALTILSGFHYAYRTGKMLPGIHGKH
ncbi:MAG TPA: CDP-alcohol phosphatidyltransferase family protein [Candidatus Acidoferrales bacterium]|nr:CDP-alcohol phosphatidyltransferase family protein [Candidatus Acidoferrales bacterium]